MSLSIVNIKSPVLMSHPNRLSMKMQNICNGYTGSFGQLTLVFYKPNFPTSTSILPIQCGSLIMPFEFSGMDFVNPLLLTPYDGISSGEAYLRNLSDEFRAHPFFSEFLDVRFLFFDSTSDKGAIEIRAKKIGLDYALGYAVPTNLTLDAATDARLAPNGNYPTNLNIKLLITLYLDPLFNPKKIALDPIYASAIIDKNSDTASFDFYDVPDMIRPFFLFDIPYNIWSIFNSRAASVDIFLSYQPTDGSFDSLSKNFSFGGINGSFQLFHDFDSFLKLFELNYFFIVDTHTKITTTQSLEFLLGSFEDLSPHIWDIFFTVFYTDGSTAVYSVPVELSASQETLIIPTGWEQNRLYLLATNKSAYKYTVHVQLDSLYISNSVTYILDHRIFPFWKQFIFQNQYSIPDTIYLHGGTKNIAKFKRDSYQLAMDDKTTISTGTWEVSTSQFFDEITYRSGWLLSAQELDRWRSFLSSPYIAFVPDTLLPCEYYDGEIATNIPIQNYERMIVVSDSVEIKEEGEFLFSIQFSLRQAFENKNFATLEKPVSLFYDTEFLATISKTNPLDSGDLIWIDVETQPEGYFAIFINGEHVAPGTYPIYNDNLMHVVIKAYRIKKVFLSSQSGYSTLSIDKIDSKHLQELVLLNFSHRLESFFQRIESLLSLKSLYINSPSYLDGDRVLSQTLKLAQGGGLVTDVSLPGFTPSALGYAVKSILASQYSLTIITL